MHTSQGIRIIKLYAWESSFIEKLSAVRQAEIALIKRISLLRALMTFMTYAMPVLVSIATFVTYSALGNTLTAAVVFPTISLFNTLVWPLGFLPEVISGLVKMNIAATRLSNFLLSSESEGLGRALELGKAEDAQHSLALTDASFFWLTERKCDSTEDEKLLGTGSVADIKKLQESPEITEENPSESTLERGFMLKNINFTLSHGELVVKHPTQNTISPDPNTPTIH